MVDEKKPPASDKSETDKPVEKPATEKPAASAASENNSKNSKTGKQSTQSDKTSPSAMDALSDKEKRAATTIIKKKMSVEEEKRALDAIITGASTAADKKKAIDELRKLHVADDIIKKRSHETPDGVKEIKQKAASAAKHAAAEKILSQGYVADADVALSRLADTFDKSARRWEMVVYPTMFAFILLAGYGFYLIYHLTHDIAVLSHSVTRMATIVSDATPRVTSDMRDVSQDMRVMSGDIRAMSFQMEALKPMSNNIANMTYTMTNLNRSVYGMQRDMGGLNRTISGGPFGFMNDVMPFSADSYKSPLPQLPPGAGQPVYIQPMPTPMPQSQQASPNGNGQ